MLKLRPSYAHLPTSYFHLKHCRVAEYLIFREKRRIREILSIHMLTNKFLACKISSGKAEICKHS